MSQVKITVEYKGVEYSYTTVTEGVRSCTTTAGGGRSVYVLHLETGGKLLINKELHDLIQSDYSVASVE